jgi:hypothetical protein
VYFSDLSPDLQPFVWVLIRATRPGTKVVTSIPGDTHPSRNSCSRESGACLSYVTRGRNIPITVSYTCWLHRFFSIYPHCDLIFLAIQPGLFDHTMSQDPDDPSTSMSSPNFESIIAAALKRTKSGRRTTFPLIPLPPRSSPVTLPIPFSSCFKLKYRRLIHLQAAMKGGQGCWTRPSQCCSPSPGSSAKWLGR